MTKSFCIVGPTAAGKSDLAADVAVRLDAEIVNADAFQIYEGFDVLTGKPDPVALGKVPHHLIGVVSPTEQMSAARYRDLALTAIAQITGRGKLALIVGGTGLYVKALTHGLDDAPAADTSLRQELDGLDLEELRLRLTVLDPGAVQTVDLRNRRRVIRAIEIAKLGGRPASEQCRRWEPKEKTTRSESNSGIGFQPMNSKPSAVSRCYEQSGVFVFRRREELYQRINQRVERMLREGAVSEVRDIDELSRTAEQMIGIKQIREQLAGRISLAECTARIQQLTRRYAKRQLTWFRQQGNFESLNLSLLNHNEAVEWVSRRAVVGRAVND